MMKYCMFSNMNQLGTFVSQTAKFLSRDIDRERVLRTNLNLEQKIRENELITINVCIHRFEEK